MLKKDQLSSVNLKQVSLSSPLSPTELWQLARLYFSAFPLEERRPLSSIKQKFLRGQLQLDVYTKNNKIIAGISTYRLHGICYIEHFVVADAYRGKGLGSDILRQIILKNQKEDIILEVEPPKYGPAAEKRIKFYQRLGFTLEPEEYVQPPYRLGEEELSLHLMRLRRTKEENISTLEIIDLLYRLVYEKENI